jgi:hypothetical protein
MLNSATASVSAALALSITLVACSSSNSTAGSGSKAAEGTGGATAKADGATNLDFDASAADFDCILNGTKVRNFYVKNKLGNEAASLAVADDTSGGTYPVGSLIQLIPTEAMIKRKVGFSPQSNDWEFFSLSVSASGTQILQRGTTAVVNAFNGNCFSCHDQAMPAYDFICEETHGCPPLPFTAAQFTAIRQADPRCGD